jgi:hypothetical protein
LDETRQKIRMTVRSLIIGSVEETQTAILRLLFSVNFTVLVLWSPVLLVFHQNKPLGHLAVPK